MENKVIQEPNFIVLKQDNNRGAFYKVTVCKKTLNVLKEEVLHEMPVGWSLLDFFELLEEGKRFFSRDDVNQIENTEDVST